MNEKQLEYPKIPKESDDEVIMENPILSDLVSTGSRKVVPHIFGCGVGVYKARQYVRKHGLSTAMRLNPKLEGAKLVEVPITICRELNRSKWSGADLREIRARNGVGRPPRA